VIVGPNAVGKTNVLEAIYFLSTGKSFRAKLEREMISYDADFCRVEGEVGETNLAIVLTKGLVERKKLMVNDVSKRLVDFAGNLKTTLFGPWDLDLVTESPSVRRRFLDMVLSQVDREYRRAIMSYEKGLRQRNRLLYRIREEGLSRSQLLFWDQLLIKNGDYITRERTKFIDYINTTGKLKIIYDFSAISEGRLEQYAEEEVAAATTLVGPHRDDFQIKDIDRDLATYGSRGEQRMGVLWLKMAELSFVEQRSGERPVLILDDIFSELDHGHRQVVMDIVGKQQTIITTADPHYIEAIKKVEIIKLSI
jgi:DNA replication and repair protein RecF